MAFKIFGLFSLVLLSLISPPALAEEDQGEGEAEPHKPSPKGRHGDFTNPVISLFADIQAFFTDSDTLDNRQKVRLKKAELALQSDLYPGIQGDFILALEQQYEGDGVSTEVHVEEGYVSFLSLPASIQARVGRKFMDFGRLNPVHTHHWSFVTRPHVLKNFLGEHNWFDDGAQAGILIPNPSFLCIKVTGGIWNGRELGHYHGEEHEGEEDHGEDQEAGEDHEHETEPGYGENAVIEWAGHVMSGRATLGWTAGDHSDFLMGVSYARDTRSVTSLIGTDITFTYHFPETDRRIRWQTEFMLADAENYGTRPWGVYAMLLYTLNKSWEIGGRFDRAEYLLDDPANVAGGSLFASYYLTHSTYIRGEYQYADYSEMGEDSLFHLQFVWGLCPHTHRHQD